jgi:transglutaminase-like putative cysteine protease
MVAATRRPAPGGWQISSRPRPAPSAGPPRKVPGQPGPTWALAAFTATSAAGLDRVFNGHRWILPVALSAGVVHLVCYLLRRRGTPGPVAAAVVAVAAVLLAAWTVFGRDTFYGFITAGTWDHAVAAVRDLGNQFAENLAPVPPTRGFELLAVGGAALAAALGDWLAFRARLPLAALVPGLAVFVYCASFGVPAGRAWVVAAEVAGAGVFLLVERASTAGGEAWFAGVRPRLEGSTWMAGGVILSAAVIVALGVVPALAPRDGRGVLGWKGGIGGGGGGERIVPNPLVDLQTRLTELGSVPVFSVVSTAPSYWRLTALDNFNGVTWTAAGTYRGIGGKLPGVPPAGPAVREVTAEFRIQKLDSPWLPAQFTPVSVMGVKGVTYDPASNSLLGAAATSDGLAYTVESYQLLDTLTPAELERATVSVDDPVVSTNLELPPGIDPAVLRLARSLTAGQGNEYAKALAIESYLRGPGFRYTLDPPSDGSGSAALANFLFVTRAGFCQQFAGAFAVLARAAGLPTRLAVGFDTGTDSGDGLYQVTDGDAHTWPEVYFGPRYGWVPFEPTPGFAIPGAGAYTGDAGSAGGPTAQAPTASTVPTTSPVTLPGPLHSHTPQAGTKATLPANGAGGATRQHSGGAALYLLAVPGVLLLAVVANGLAPLAAREYRRRRARAAGAAAVVTNEWDEVGRALARMGLGRQPSETDDEYARRATAGLVRIAVVPEQARWENGGPLRLAGLARRARWSSSVPEEDGPAAAAAAAEILRRLEDSLTWTEKAARWVSPPREAWSRLLGGRAGTPG